MIKKTSYYILCAASLLMVGYCSVLQDTRTGNFSKLSSNAYGHVLLIVLCVLFGIVYAAVNNLLFGRKRAITVFCATILPGIVPLIDGTAWYDIHVFFSYFSFFLLTVLLLLMFERYKTWNYREGETLRCIFLFAVFMFGVLFLNYQCVNIICEDIYLTVSMVCCLYIYTKLKKEA